MKNNVLKKLMILGIGSMLLMGSSVSADNAEDAYYEHTNQDHIMIQPEWRSSCTDPFIYTYWVCVECNVATIGFCDYAGAAGHIDSNKDHYCDREIRSIDPATLQIYTTVCGERLSCSGGTATCMNRAVCEICGHSYGHVNETNHAGGIALLNTKEATCTKDGYSGDTYCKGCTVKLADGTVIPATGHSGGTATCKDKAICAACGKQYGDVDRTNHINTELRNVKEATCTEDGYTGDTYCKDCGKQLSTGTVIPATGHSGGTATCKDKAVCEVCGKQYGDVDRYTHINTNLVHVKPVTCTKDGYTGDAQCIDCGIVQGGGTVIPATGHKDTDNDHYCNNKVPDRYASDGLGICNEKISECSGGTATCVSQAVCDICKKLYGEVDSDNHVGETAVQNNKEATCEEDGYSGDTYCESCNNVVETGSKLPRLGHIDEDTNHICDRETCGKVLSECTGGEATCKDLAVCEYCGREYGEKDMSKHVGDTEIRDAKPATCTEDGYTGDTYCTSCDTKLLDGEPIAKLGHTDENKDHYCDREDCKAKLSECTGGVATCKDQAICEYCGSAYGELNAANHIGDTEIRDAKEATCCEDGYTGDTYCTSCNTKLLDGTIIPATGHVDNDDNNECDTCGIIINETEKQTESKPVVEETESNLPEAPKTGDTTPVVALFSLLLGSIAIIFTCGTYRSRKED